MANIHMLKNQKSFRHKKQREPFIVVSVLIIGAEMSEPSVQFKHGCKLLIYRVRVLRSDVFFAFTTQN